MANIFRKIKFQTLTWMVAMLPLISSAQSISPPAQSQDMSMDQFKQWLQNTSNSPTALTGNANIGQSSSARPPARIAPPPAAPRVTSAASTPNAPPANPPPPQAAMPFTLSQLPPKNPPPPPRRHKRPADQLTYEEGQRLMLSQVPPDSPRPNDDSNLAFNAMLQQNMPLTPGQVVQLHQSIDRAQRAAAIPPNIPPKPVSTTLMINLAPGTTPPAVRLAQGYVSSLVFVDSTGAPWPIAAFDIGNPKAMNIQWDQRSNILLMQAVSPYSDGNMVVRLVGLPTPITLELVSGQRVVDFRVDIHVSGIGPNAKEMPIGNDLPQSASQLLLGVLDGVAPAGSRTLTVPGGEAQAWLLADKIYLRTRFTVLSPGWVGTMVSPDGMHAYEIPRTSTVLISRYGEPAELRIEGL